MSFLQAFAAEEGRRSVAFAQLPKAPLDFCGACSAPAAEEVEDSLGGPADLSRPVVPRNLVAKKALDSRVRAAVLRVAEETEKQVRLGRLVLLGLALVQLARVSDLLAGGSSILEGPFSPIQFLCVSSDIGCLAIAAPVLMQRLGGYSPAFGYMGPMVTGIAALGVIDMCSFIAFLVLAVRTPVSPGNLRDSEAARWRDTIFANVGVAEMTMSASISLQAALCACVWRIYVSVREAGLYPVGDPARPLTEVSLLEVFCDEEGPNDCGVEWCDGPAKASAPKEADSGGKPEPEIPRPAAAAGPPASPEPKTRSPKDGSVSSPDSTASTTAASSAAHTAALSASPATGLARRCWTPREMGLARRC